jgi:Family of unknown function (DUF5681)
MEQREVGGITGKGFRPGRSGNPGGRPKGFVGAIRKQTRDGAELVTFFVSIFRDPKVKVADRMAAATWLADRAFGRPRLAVEVEVGEPMIPARVITRGAAEFNEKMARLAASVRGTPPPDPARASLATLIASAMPEPQPPEASTPSMRERLPQQEPSPHLSFEEKIRRRFEDDGESR